MRDLPAGLRRLATEWAEIDYPAEFGDAVRYAHSMHEHPFEFYLARLRQIGFRGRRVLDAGSGTATWSFPMTVDSGHVYAVDRNPPRVGLSQWLASEYELQGLSIADADITAMEFPPGYFDAVWCYGVVISYLDLSDVLREFRRVMTTDGHLYMCINGPGWTQHLRKERAVRDGDRYREMGENGAYNTICTTVLEPLRRQLADQEEEASEAVVEVFSGVAAETVDLPSVYDRLFSLGDRLGTGHSNQVIEAVDRIEQECGPAYVRTLVGDLQSLGSGDSQVFSHHRASRGYVPGEVAAALSSCGFDRFRWADEGMLHTEGQTLAGSLFDGWFGGQRMVWEFEARAH